MNLTLEIEIEIEKEMERREEKRDWFEVKNYQIIHETNLVEDSMCKSGEKLEEAEEAQFISLDGDWNSDLVLSGIIVVVGANVCAYH